MRVRACRRRLGRNFEVGNSHAAFVSQRMICWITRLHTPQPSSAAEIPAAALSTVDRTSPIANRLKSRRLAIRALATAMLPPIVRISESVARTGARSGRAKMRETGQDNALKRTVKLTPMAVDIQNTVDSSSADGFCCRIRAVPKPASASTLDNKNERHRKADQAERFRAEQPRKDRKDEKLKPDPRRVDGSHRDCAEKRAPIAHELEDPLASR